MTGGKRFGGGRVPTGTPSLAWSSVVIVASLLAGASIVHNIYKPDMVCPDGPRTTLHTAHHLFDTMSTPDHLFIYPLLQTIPPVEGAAGGGGQES